MFAQVYGIHVVLALERDEHHEHRVPRLSLCCGSGGTKRDSYVWSNSELDHFGISNQIVDISNWKRLNIEMGG